MTDSPIVQEFMKIVFLSNTSQLKVAVPFSTGFFFTTKETKGHKGKKAENILCVPHLHLRAVQVL